MSGEQFWQNLEILCKQNKVNELILDKVNEHKLIYRSFLLQLEMRKRIGQGIQQCINYRAVAV